MFNFIDTIKTIFPVQVIAPDCLPLNIIKQVPQVVTHLIECLQQTPPPHQNWQTIQQPVEQSQHLHKKNTVPPPQLKTQQSILLIKVGRLQTRRLSEVAHIDCQNQ